MKTFSLVALLAAASLSLIPTIVEAQEIDVTVGDKFNQGSYSGAYHGLFNYAPFSASLQYSGAFGPETLINNGTDHASTVATSSIVIPTAAAPALNGFLSTISPNLNIAEINAANLSGTTRTDISRTIPAGATSQTPFTVDAVFDVESASTSFFADANYTYSASFSYQVIDEGTINSTNTPTAGNQSFSASDAAGWMTQLPYVSDSMHLVIDRCAGTQCTLYEADMYANQGAVSAVTVAAVPEAAPLELSLAGMGFIGLLALRNRRSKSV